MPETYTLCDTTTSNTALAFLMWLCPHTRHASSVRWSDAALKLGEDIFRNKSVKHM